MEWVKLFGSPTCELERKLQLEKKKMNMMIGVKMEPPILLYRTKWQHRTTETAIRTHHALFTQSLTQTPTPSAALHTSPHANHANVFSRPQLSAHVPIKIGTSRNENRRRNGMFRSRDGKRGGKPATQLDCHFQQRAFGHITWPWSPATAILLAGGWRSKKEKESPTCAWETCGAGCRSALGKGL